MTGPVEMAGPPEASAGPSDTVAPVTETAHANAGSDASEASDIPRHSQIAIDLLHGRSTVGAPRVSPDGSHAACRPAKHQTADLRHLG